MSERERTTTVLRRFQVDLAEVTSDLVDVRQWLDDHAENLTDADVANIRLLGVLIQVPTGVAVQVQCRDARSLARVTRALIHRGGIGDITKNLDEVNAFAHVLRRFGRVTIDVWAPYPCTTVRRVTPGGGLETTVTCPPLLSLAVA